MKKELVTLDSLLVAKCDHLKSQRFSYQFQYVSTEPDLLFQLSVSEYDSLRSQNVTLENKQNLRSHFLTSNSEKNERFQNNSLLEDSLRFQNGTSKYLQGSRRYLLYASTEQGLMRGRL